MIDKIKKILENTREEDICDFYYYMWGEDCSSSTKDEKIYHIINHLKQFLINRRISMKLKDEKHFINSTIKANIILLWIREKGGDIHRK